MTATVELKNGNPSIATEKNETILDAAIRLGRQLPYGCRDGACGACKAKLLEGEIDYNGANISALKEQEQTDGTILLCKAIPKTNVTIDVKEIQTEAAIPVHKYPCRVERMEKLCHDIMGLWLKLPSNNRMQFRAGQYINILLKDGRERSFSVANAPHDDDYLQLHIRYYAGGASRVLSVPSHWMSNQNVR